MSRELVSKVQHGLGDPHLGPTEGSHMDLGRREVRYAVRELEVKKPI